jgi:hypothetical protein
VARPGSGRGRDLRGFSFRGFARAAGNADRDALTDLLNEADETLRLLNEGADMLRVFIRGNIPIEEYEALAPSWLPQLAGCLVCVPA